jgi:hypothetical protein
MKKVHKIQAKKRYGTYRQTANWPCETQSWSMPHK